ncbi:hypothetical protein K492DRAFT_208763 [Lichtheimia hyalospora FSU 10163]|nr:hypothetical protein K492DRAFT_208763 [Lichtheimia hyalospora FSU 10163]
MQSLIWLVFWLLRIADVFAYKELNNGALERVADKTDRVANELLTPLMVPRVAGSTGNANVRNHIIHHFETLGWHVELDSFNDTTPFGDKPFTNVIATKNPDAPNRLVLAAHFDSKYFNDFVFIGATDSAVPCALLLDIAEVLNNSIPTTDSMTTLQLVFFDGEEAFVQWSETDSTYGARHLASLWEATPIQPKPSNTIHSFNKLSGIDALVLLDLLGTPNPSIPNYFRETDTLYQRLHNLETRLAHNNLLETQSTKIKEPLHSIFAPDHLLTFNGRAMSDDHIPFLRRGVDILHLIPHPFPKEWHNEMDNADCIDPPVVRNLARLFRGFVLEYLELDVSKL